MTFHVERNNARNCIFMGWARRGLWTRSATESDLASQARAREGVRCANPRQHRGHETRRGRRDHRSGEVLPHFNAEDVQFRIPRKTRNRIRPLFSAHVRCATRQNFSRTRRPSSPRSTSATRSTCEDGARLCAPSQLDRARRRSSIRLWKRKKGHRDSCLALPSVAS